MTGGMDMNPSTLDEFLDRGRPHTVYRKGHSIKISGADLPAETEIWAMEYVIP